MNSSGGGLRTEHIGGADLHARRAECQHCGDTLRVSDTTSGNDWDFYLPDDLRHERERAQLQVQVSRNKMATVPAGLEALGDNRIGSVRLQPARLLNGGSRR